ncbi:hypothetical protein Vretifemale_19722, partial [Volvox reticuliferus]
MLAGWKGCGQCLPRSEHPASREGPLARIEWLCAAKQVNHEKTGPRPCAACVSFAKQQPAIDEGNLDGVLNGGKVHVEVQARPDTMRVMMLERGCGSGSDGGDGGWQRWCGRAVAGLEAVVVAVVVVVVAVADAMNGDRRTR